MQEENPAIIALYEKRKAENEAHIKNMIDAALKARHEALLRPGLNGPMWFEQLGPKRA